MKRNVLSAFCLLGMGMMGNAFADGWVSGQTGQYHLLPDGMDTQKITLVGKSDPACLYGLGMFLTDEWGSIDTSRFTVPFATVFLLTDVTFSGHTPYFCKGCLAELDIYGTYEGSPRARGKFILPTPLVGVNNEMFGGTQSLTSGIAYPVNTQLCAYASYLTPASAGTTTLDQIVVHGTVVTNHRTTVAPWLTW